MRSYALAEVEKLIQSHGKSMKDDYRTMPRSDVSILHMARNTLMYDELRYDKDVLAEEHARLMSTMTAEQKRIYNKIITRVDENKPGVGKTFIWMALSSAIRSRGEIVLTVASSGIAALLIPGGRMAHSRFGIPIVIDQCSTCGIHPKSPLAELI